MVEEAKHVSNDSDKEGDAVRPRMLLSPLHWSLTSVQETFEDAPDSTPQPTTPPTEPTVEHPQPSEAAEPSSTISTPEVPTAAATSENPSEPQETESGADGNPRDSGVPQKSPLLTAHRVSTSSIDNEHLENKPNTSSTQSIPSIDPPADKTPEQVAVPDKPPAKIRGRSGNLPSMPWATSPTPKPAGNAPSGPPPKKLGMSFSWLSRGTSANKDAPPTITPAAPASSTLAARRPTVSSLTSNPELMLEKLNTDGEQDSAQVTTVSKTQRDSLRERFKMLRMREEAGLKSPDGQEATSPGEGGALAGLIGRSASVGVGIGSPTSVADEKEGGLARSPPQSPDPTMPPAVLPSANPALAPGTASGVSAGASAMTEPGEPVNWDLWQSVVYEGPAAVARTSAEELNRAIASGIPSAIRGVVWQVLAESKNEELEGVYRELVARGTDKDHDHVAALNGQLSQSTLTNGHTKEKASIASSGSSVQLDHATPGTPHTNGVLSPTTSQEEDSESIAKIHAAMIAERKQKAKDDAASLQKLEKAIKRDLGARTSYSKYAAAAGLQDGLFGVCKAYALFDEGVGYAQGMNFLAMPLLFNVSPCQMNTG